MKKQKKKLQQKQHIQLRTQKHKLLFCVSDVSKASLIDWFKLYQKHKQMFSLALNDSNFNNQINSKHNFGFIPIRNEYLKDMKEHNSSSSSNYSGIFSYAQYNLLSYKNKKLTARMWKQALSESFHIQNRTYAAALERCQDKLNQYCFNYLFKQHNFNNDEIKLMLYFNGAVCSQQVFFEVTYGARHKRETFIEYFKELFNKCFNTLFKKKKPELNSLNECKRSSNGRSFNFVSYCNRIKYYYKQCVKQTNVSNIHSKLQGTVILDQDCYSIESVYDHKSKHYRHFISIVSFADEKRNKRCFELSGYHHIPNLKKMNFAKTITLSFDCEKDKINFYIHFTFKQKKYSKSAAEVEGVAENKGKGAVNVLAVDWGHTELFTATNGKDLNCVFGENNGVVYRTLANEYLQNQKQLCLSKLSSNKAVSSNAGTGVAKNNLYNHADYIINKRQLRKNKRQLRKQQLNSQLQAQLQLQLQLRYALLDKNKKIQRQLEQFQLKTIAEMARFLTKHDIDVLVYENIDINQVKSSKNRSKKMKRELNLMPVHILVTKVSSKVTQYNYKFKAVAINPSYTSQTCSHCGYVDAKNRNGDMFCCLSCGFKCDPQDNVMFLSENDNCSQQTLLSSSDLNAALNILNRDKWIDELLGINIYTKSSEIKIKLLQLHHICKDNNLQYDCESVTAYLKEKQSQP